MSSTGSSHRRRFECGVGPDRAYDCLIQRCRPARAAGVRRLRGVQGIYLVAGRLRENGRYTRTGFTSLRAPPSWTPIGSTRGRRSVVARPAFRTDGRHRPFNRGAFAGASVTVCRDGGLPCGVPRVPPAEPCAGTSVRLGGHRRAVVPADPEATDYARRRLAKRCHRCGHGAMSRPNPSLDCHWRQGRRWRSQARWLRPFDGAAPD